jgi:hypothetical protein
VQKSYGYKLKFFAFNGIGPWQCFFCTQEVKIDWDMIQPNDYAIHHINGNHEDNTISNLAMAHSGCHSRHHARTDGRALTMVKNRKHEPWVENVRKASQRHAENIVNCDSCNRECRGVGGLKTHQRYCVARLV